MDVNVLLTEILGDNGAKPIAKALSAYPDTQSSLIPRVLLSWVKNQEEYQGSIPGSEESWVTLKKTESGYVGAAANGPNEFTFDSASDVRVASVLSVLLGIQSVTPVQSTLAKSIDALAKVYALNKSVKPTQMSVHGAYHVRHEGKGTHPYTVVHTETDLPVQSRIDKLSSAQKIGDWFSTKHKGTFVAKKVLDPSMGYSFSHDLHDMGNGTSLSKVTAHAPTGEPVGFATFLHGPKGLTPGSVVVDEDHQRRGIASAMYGHAQKTTGKTVVPSANQTDEGAALWQGNAHKPQFGGAVAKTDLPGTAAPPIEPKGPVGPKMEPKRVKKPTSKKNPSISLTKAEMATKCVLCGQPQFSEGKFTGCICLNAFAKSIKTKTFKDGCILEIRAKEDIEDLHSVLCKQFKVA